MFYDTCYRHNEALQPDALASVPNALHALNAAIEDCRRAGKAPDDDAAVLLLIRNLSDVAERTAPSPFELRARCARDRDAVISYPAFLSIAGNSVGDNLPAKRTFHFQVRRQLRRLAEAIGIDPDAARINSLLGRDHEDGMTELHHADIGIRVMPRGFLPDCEISFWRCRNGAPAGRSHSAPIAELLDTAAFECRLVSVIGSLRAPAARAA